MSHRGACAHRHFGRGDVYHPPVPRLLRSIGRAALFAAGGVLAPLAPAGAQDTTRTPIVEAIPPAPPRDPRLVAQNAQAEFERFRRLNLPPYRGRVPSGRQCPEPVGLNWCYWYDEDSTLEPERDTVVVARERLIALLDTLGRENPGDNWIGGQQVRYLIEAHRPADGLKVVERCRAFGWWCDALAGLTYHEMGRYAEAEARFEKVLAQLSARERCRWLDMTPYLDEDTRRQYIRNPCGSDERAAFEARAWWFARTRYGMAGNDSRTEHFSRLVYVEILRDAASAYVRAFDESEREMLIRFGWARQWAQNGETRPPNGDDIRMMPDGSRPPMDRSMMVNVIGQEASPAHRFIPPADVLTSPASSDSTDWAVQLPPVVARYHPIYASRLLMLEHQQGLFRRGDTAIIVVAYDVTKVRGLNGAPLEAALVVTPGTTPNGTGTRVRNAPAKGTITVKAPWGPLLMSAEVEAEQASTLVRARYGIRPPFAIGARVSLSDLVFYTPYDGFPASVEEVLPHLIPTQLVRADQPLGVYWEAYNTNPAGERMTISLVVAPDDEEEPGRMTRAARALRLARGTSPVSVTINDQSVRGARMSPRAVQLDISTLKPGDYLVQLEVDVAGQYVIRADRRITVVPSR